MKQLLTFIVCLLVGTSSFAANRCESLFLNLGAQEQIRNFDEHTDVLHNGFENLIQVLESGKPKEQKIVRKELNKIFSGDRSPRQVQKSIVKLYRVANEPSRNIIKILTEDIPSIEKRIIQKRVQTQILQHDIFTALQNLGLLRNLTPADKARLFAGRNSNVVEVISSTAINSFFLYWFNMFGAIPAIQVSQLQKIKPELIQKVRDEGFEAVYPELLKTFKNKAKVDIVFRAASLTYSVYMMILVPQLVAEHYNMVRLGIGLATMTEASMAKYEQEHFDPVKIREGRYEAWKTGYEAFNGKLDESNPKDRALMEEKRKSLARISDEDLHVFKH